MPTIQLLSNPELFSEKTNAYLKIREREGRVLTDIQVQTLPNFQATSQNQISLQREWRLRAHSFLRFKKYLLRKFQNRTLNILDLGCGNGWMALNLAKLPKTEILAADVNLPELEQGTRIAEDLGYPNIRFAFANILENGLPENQFDLVVLAASVQYFPDLEQLFTAVNRVLKPGGEIHLLDSPFYKTEAKRQSARMGTKTYYENLGVPEMANWYHHHLWEDVAMLGGKDLNAGIWSKILQKVRWLPPFPWVVFR